MSTRFHLKMYVCISFVIRWVQFQKPWQDEKNNTCVLMKKTFDNLKSFNVEEIVDEIHKKLPEIFQIHYATEGPEK